MGDRPKGAWDNARYGDLETRRSSVCETLIMNGAADGRIGTVLHAADLHLGAPLQSLGNQLDQRTADRVRHHATRAYENLVDLAIDEGVEVVVLAGDVYDHAERDVAAQVRFTRGLRRLTEQGIAVFIAHGNHDPLIRNLKLAAQLPEHVTVFEPGDPQTHTVTLRDDATLHVTGVSFGKVHEEANLAERFHQLDTPASHTVGVLHTNVGSQTGHGNYAPCTVEDLIRAPIGYWALGHIHKREVRPIESGRWWAYPGNLQGRSAKTSECGPKGALVVPVLADGFGEPEFRACAEVRFERIDVDVSESPDLSSAIDAAAAAVPEPEGTEHIVVARIRLVGRSDANRQLISAGATRLLTLVQEALDDDDHRVAMKVEIATRSAIERSVLLARGDILAEALRRIDSLEGQPETMLEVHLKPNIARLLEELQAGDDTIGRQLVERAEQQLIEHLDEDL